MREGNRGSMSKGACNSKNNGPIPGSHLSIEEITMRYSVIAASLGLVFASTLALAAERAQMPSGQAIAKPGEIPPGAIAAASCPPGWKLDGAPGAYGAFWCSPTPPSPMNCPPGTKFLIGAGGCKAGCQVVSH